MTFRDYIASLDVVPPDVLTPGKWQRCSTLAHPRKKNASVKITDDGMVGFVHDFATMAEPAIWRPESREQSFRIDEKEVRSRIAAKRRELIEATMAARTFYETCSPLRNSHPYLSGKGLSMEGCDGLRLDHKGNLVVPMRIKGSLVSIQRIAPDGTKLFWSGATTNGTSYVINRANYLVTLVCEGLATGLTLFGAVNDCRVIVAFNAGNLSRAMVHHNVSGMCAVCADNDSETASRIGKNPGVDGAAKAAELMGCSIAIPHPDKGTDFDDWRQELLAFERQQNLFRQRKLTDHQMLAIVRSKIKDAIMPHLVYITSDSP